MEEDILNAIRCLRQGGLILYPTDTIWGIGCDATNKEAVAKVYALKERDDAKSLIMLVDSEATLERYVKEIPEAAEQLIEVAVRPLTIIYDHAEGIAENAMAPDGSAAFRITSEKFSSLLCRKFGKPIVSTSANVSGDPSPKCFADIDERIISGVDYVCSYGRECKTPASPSEIIKVTDSNEVTIIRPL